VASITETPPTAIREELTRLRRQLGRDIPKKTDRNLLIATWNLREFGDLTRKWDSTQADTPKRDLHALACIKEVVKRFDVVAIQEAQKSLGALRELFLTEQDASEDRVTLQPAQTLLESYIEAVLLDAGGEPTRHKRILFP
jgi:hypothetical protein